jgi:hypothetical protein
MWLTSQRLPQQATRRISRRAASVTSAVAVLGLLGLPAPAAAPVSAAVKPATAPSCRNGVLTPAPSPGMYVEFFGISALAGNDVWAAGTWDSGVGVVVHRPLIEHWNGTAWSRVTSPRPMPNVTYYAVKAISASNVWAVGLRSQTQVSQEFPVIVHWNGTSWSVVPSPSVDGFLGAIAVASPNDIWAVGLQGTNSGAIPGQTLAEHWNGRAWSVVPTPSPGKDGAILGGVTVAGPNDVWATGQQGTNRFDHAPLSEHWNGHAWSVVKMPPESFNSGVGSVTSAGPDDLWASGWYDTQTPTGTVTLTLAEHWNGHRWLLNFPPSPTGDDKLNDITAVSASDIWAVGDTALNRTFVLHWNGRGWKELSPGLAQKGNVNTLWSVSAPTATGIWAAGGGYHTLVEHICPVSG